MSLRDQPQQEGPVQVTTETKGAFDLLQAPVFYPTEEEFSNPWTYLLSIKPQIEECGICVIQPPRSSPPGTGWDFDSFHKQINPKKFSFLTKAQNVHQMQCRTGPSVTFLQQLKQFWRSRGETFAMPELSGTVVDLCLLKKEVEKRGGFQNVDDTVAWEDIARALKLICPEDETPARKTVRSALRDLYVEILAPYLESEVKTEQELSPKKEEETNFFDFHSPQRVTGFDNRDVDMTALKPDPGSSGLLTRSKTGKLPTGKSRDSKIIESPLAGEKRRFSSWVQSTRPPKRRKLASDPNEPLWCQVKSRSFAKDANELRETWAKGCLEESNNQMMAIKVEPSMEQHPGTPVKGAFTVCTPPGSPISPNYNKPGTFGVTTPVGIKTFMGVQAPVSQKCSPQPPILGTRTVISPLASNVYTDLNAGCMANQVIRTQSPLGMGANPYVLASPYPTNSPPYSSMGQYSRPVYTVTPTGWTSRPSVNNNSYLGMNLGNYPNKGQVSPNHGLSGQYMNTPMAHGSVSPLVPSGSSLIQSPSFGYSLGMNNISMGPTLSPPLPLRNSGLDSIGANKPTRSSRSKNMKGRMRRFNNDSNIEDDSDDEMKDFGYGMGKRYNLAQFQEMATKFEKRWSHVCKTELEKEREYWRLVETGEDFVQVQYGSDLDVGTHGSGFPFNPNARIKHEQNLKDTGRNSLPRKKQEESEYMLTSGWNVTNLAEKTFLNHLGESVAGLTRPMMYVGMLFSSFCWHVEDNYLYSINYVHVGKPKRWYGVPGSGADKFEQTMREKLPDLFERNPNLLHLLVTQLSPSILSAAGVPVYTALQQQGQFVVTCPRSYHAGFNTGFNCAESVNFALEDWLPFCKKACDDYRFQRSAVFPFEEFVLRSAKNPDTPHIAKLLKAELENLIEREQAAQTELKQQGLIEDHQPQPQAQAQSQLGQDSSTLYQPCRVCGYDCYLSGITCLRHSGYVACLRHMSELCNCQISEKRLVVHISLTELQATLEHVSSKAATG